MNLNHTLASNETKQPTSILAEKFLLQQKLNTPHHKTDQRGIDQRETKIRKPKTETRKPAKNER